MADREFTLENAIFHVTGAAAVLDIVFHQFERSALATESLVERDGVENAWIQVWLTDAENLAIRRAISDMVETVSKLGDAYKAT